jgi:23S rRNA (guanine745-N1)-methyltransferase
MNYTDYLVCPVCHGALSIHGHSLLCDGANGKRHCFDISRSGYVDLSHRSGGGGDPKDAVADRTQFLNRGYYAPLADKICELCEKYLPKNPFIVDAGCGEGYYSDKIAKLFSEGYLFGADLSKHAVHRASVRRNESGAKNSFYAVASVFDLPVLDGSAGGLVSMFAPVSEEEFSRVLADNGILIVGCAAPKHLYELKRAIYDDVYLNEERADLPLNMSLLESSNVSYSVLIDNNKDLMTLFGMTPYRFRTSESSYSKLCALESLVVDVDVEFRVYQNNKTF